MDYINQLRTVIAWPQELILIAGFFLLAYVVHRLAGRVSERFIRLSRFTAVSRRPRPERLATLQSLLASMISFSAFALAILLTLNQFVEANTLIWLVGLFSAAFGLGARPLLSDFLTGVSFIFENSFDVGEKVEILGVEGVVEAVNLRTTLLRASGGELYIIPNGEVRMVRNFSRGRYSVADVKLKVPTADLNRSIAILEGMAEEAVVLLPNLLEPWRIINTSGVIGLHAELTLVSKARFAEAAALRPRLLALVHERLDEAGIYLVD
jgi:moderate conductance mechanosensitive channel